MSGSGLLALLDDITLILDDVAAMSKLAAKKTAGIVGDDLAVNANVVVGIDPSRELPIVGKIALGSLLNKAILIPLALALPGPAITPLLMFGGAFLCYEALHKVSHKHSPEDEAHHQELVTAIQSSPDALMKLENKKIWGAIGTDTILSAEVVAVALGAVAQAPLMTKALTLSLVGLAMTVGVYGLVAAIVKADDLGLRLQSAEGDSAGARSKRRLGELLLAAMPWFMKGLSIVGTGAMFAVGGGILLHGIPALEHMLLGSLAPIPFLGGPLSLLISVLFGVVVGFVCLPIFGFLGKALSALKVRFTGLSRGHGDA
jgi:predicted DNA repair protein MutK